MLCPSSLSLLVILMMPNHTMFVMDISENYIEHLADTIGREASVRVCVDGEGDSMDLTMEGILSSTLQTCSVLTFTIYDTA